MELSDAGVVSVTEKEHDFAVYFFIKIHNECLESQYLRNY